MVLSLPLLVIFQDILQNISKMQISSCSQSGSNWMRAPEEQDRKAGKFLHTHEESHRKNILTLNGSYQKQASIIFPQSKVAFVGEVYKTTRKVFQKCVWGRGNKLKHLERPGWKYREWRRGGGQQEIQCNHLKMVASSQLQFRRHRPKSTGFQGFLNKRARSLFFIFLKFQNEGNLLKMNTRRPNKLFGHMILSLPSRSLVKPVV